MEQGRNQRSYIKTVLNKTGWNQTELAKRAGLDPSTLSRFLSSQSGMPSLRRTSIQRIVAATGIAFADEDLAIQAEGLSESEARPLAADAPPLSTAILQWLRERHGAVDAWTLHSRALELAGYRPGDTLYVQLGATALKSDVVCAQVYDWNSNGTQTIFRIFEPPYLAAATAEPGLIRPYSIEDDRVVIKGVVLHSMRGKA